MIMIKFFSVPVRWLCLCWLCLYCSLAMLNVAKANNTTVSQFKQWQASSLPATNIEESSHLVKPVLQAFTADANQLRALLLNKTTNIVISVPLPDGQLIDFILTPSSIMAAELAQSYPEIKTFTGVQVGNANNSGRFDITPNGFHGMFNYDGEVVFIEPETAVVSTYELQSKQALPYGLQRNSKLGLKPILQRKFNQTDNYQSYLGKKVQLADRAKYQFHQPKLSAEINSSWLQTANNAATVSEVTAAKSAPSQSAIRTYRLAISTAAEYSQFNGGTVDSAMAEIVTLVNRLNEVFQRDLAVKLELVANNNLLIFTDPATDPFANTSDDGEINTQVINDIIGSNSYDIGHVVGTNGGGVALLGAVCSAQVKGDGVTGSPTPNNDAFYIDYVAHEVGHQFGANHTFNGSAGACAGNREEDAAYEVGSGSTIMSYAGICGNQNLQDHSDAFFHSKSIDEVSAFITSGDGSNCGSVTGETNNTAIVDAGADYTIPANTPFILTGSATDVDNDSLTYSWQQYDLGTVSASVAEQVDDGSRPLFRAWSPVSNSDRVLPKLDSVLTNSTSIGETFASTDRSLNFRLLVRDGEGGVSFDSNEITVVDTGESFAVSAPLLNDTWSSNNQNVSWQVAQTNSSPINCASVDVLLSTDGGSNFTKTLLSNTANNGSSEVSLSAYCADDINTDAARIKVACSDNIFFAINSGDFTINKMASGTDIAITSQQTLSINQGESLAITSELFTYGCDTPTSITINSGNDYSVEGNTVTPNSDFSGTLNVGIISHKSGISSDVFTASITVVAIAEPEPEPEPEPTEPDPTEPEVVTTTSESSGSVFWLLSAIVILALRRGVFAPKAKG